jgi:hypothetical protein
MVWFKTNLAESSKGSYGSKRAVLPVMTMMIMMMLMKVSLNNPQINTIIIKVSKEITKSGNNI